MVALDEVGCLDGHSGAGPVAVRWRLRLHPGRQWHVAAAAAPARRPEIVAT